MSVSLWPDLVFARQKVEWLFPLHCWYPTQAGDGRLLGSDNAERLTSASTLGYIDRRGWRRDVP